MSAAIRGGREPFISLLLLFDRRGRKKRKDQMRGNPIPDPSSSSSDGGGGGLSGDPHPRLTLNTKGLILEKAKKKKYDARFLFSEFHTKGKT